MVRALDAALLTLSLWWIEVASVSHVHLAPSGQLCVRQLVLGLLRGVVQPYKVAPWGVLMVEECICLHIPLAR